MFYVIDPNWLHGTDGRHRINYTALWPLLPAQAARDGYVSGHCKNNGVSQQTQNISTPMA